MADPTFPVGQVIPTVDQTFHDEETLFKVQAAITSQGFTGQPVLDIIAAMQNKGILFRERVPEAWLDHPKRVPPERVSIARRMRADADEAEAFERDDAITTQAEEPIEDRLHRAYTNGLQQGLTLGRNIMGRWDHS